MSKKLFISLVLVVVLSGFLGANSVYGADNEKPMLKPNEQNGIMQPRAHEYFGQVPPAARYFGPGPQIDKKHPMKLNGSKHHNRAEMQAKKAEFEKRLKLTDEQKKKIEENKKADREKIKPIFEQIKLKDKEIREVIESTKLTDVQKSQKTKELMEEVKALKAQANELRKDNMNYFESVLTDKQKKEFEKIKKEQKKEMEKRKKNFEKRKKELSKDKKAITKPAVEPKPVQLEK